MKEGQEKFFELLNELGTGERAALRREAGVMIQNADGAALKAFYRCLPRTVPQYKEEVWFGAACLRCLWDTDDVNEESLEKIIASLIREGELSESISHRVEILLETKWDKDGYMLSKLCRLVKMVRQKSNGIMIDFVPLLEDLINWNSDSQYVQRKWARSIFGNEESDKKERE